MPFKVEWNSNNIRWQRYQEGFFPFFFFSGKTIDELELEIQAGVYFKGTLNILEVEVFAEININTDPEALRIYAKVTMSPISWVGGKVKQK